MGLGTPFRVADSVIDCLLHRQDVEPALLLKPDFGSQQSVLDGKTLPWPHVTDKDSLALRLTVKVPL